MSAVDVLIKRVVHGSADMPQGVRVQLESQRGIQISKDAPFRHANRG